MTESPSLRLLARLYAIDRTLLGRGYTESLALLGEVLPLDVVRFPSGANAGSWTIPDEWVLHRAVVESLDGRVVLDAADHPLRV